MYDGGYYLLSGKLVRSGFQEHTSALTEPFGAETIRAVNILQATAWRINTAILEVMREAWLAGSTIADIPPGDLQPLSRIPDDVWETMTKEERGIHKTRLTMVHGENAHQESRRYSWLAKLDMATQLAEEPAIWFPYYADFRGRLYPDVSDLSPQSDDAGKMQKEGVRVPAVIEFPRVKVPGKLRWFTPEEVAKLLHELDPNLEFWGRRGNMKGIKITLNPVVRQQRQDAYDLAVTLLDTGARLSEIGEIPWSSIDILGWRGIDLYRSKTSNSSMLTMTERLREVLQRRYAARGNSAYVFPGYTDDGADTPRGQSSHAIRRAIERAGLNSNPAQVKRDGRATCHTFRDTFASWLVQRGVSLFKVQMLLGHSDPRMTQKYAKLAPGAVADEAAAVLDQLATERAA
jgi:integrase